MQEQKLAWFVGYLALCDKEIYAKNPFKFLPWSDLEIYKLSNNHD